jgi:selenocysteine lyase/cysteine desulfurase
VFIMTIQELHSNEELRRHEFPVCAERVFLGHAGVCPLPQRVVKAITDYSRLAAAGDQEDAFAGTRILACRQLAARILNAEVEEIALVGPTSNGLNSVASGLPFRKGDNILIYQDDFPSNVFPWMALAERGVQVRFLNIRELGRIRTADVTGQVDENTRLVALASCHYVTGWRLDLAGIGKYLRDRNILFCVDGIQTLGAFPTTVEQVDFLAADAHKWLLGPLAAGIFYVRKAIQERLRPRVLGWHNVRCPDYIAPDQIAFRPDARRYEAGSANLLGLAGLQAAMELILEMGVAAIAAEALRKRAWLVPALQAKGCAVLHAAPPAEHASSIITFYRPEEDMPALHAKLTAANIVTSLRVSRGGQRYIRLSPHFYNTDAELGRVMELL